MIKLHGKKTLLSKIFFFKNIILKVYNINKKIYNIFYLNNISIFDFFYYFKNEDIILHNELNMVNY